MYQKNFDEWNLVKQSLDGFRVEIPHIRAGEVRWVDLGVNIGSEIDGKGTTFSRPCLIIHVIGGKRAIVVPITSKIKTDDGYINFELDGRSDTLCLNQIRSLSQKRIFRRMGKISNDKLDLVRKEIGKYLEII